MVLPNCIWGYEFFVRNKPCSPETYPLALIAPDASIAGNNDEFCKPETTKVDVFPDPLTIKEPVISESPSLVPVDLKVSAVAPIAFDEVV